MEVPEIYDGTVEIRSVAREAGDRSKISVYAENTDVDPVGSCVGPKGQRVQRIVDELKGEKIDIVRWSNDPVEYVANALSPSQVVKVLVDEEEKATTVVVPDHQLSLAIGKRGQNARLAPKLTGWKIDIKSESDAKQLGIVTEEDSVSHLDSIQWKTKSNRGDEYEQSKSSVTKMCCNARNEIKTRARSHCSFQRGRSVH